MATSAPETIISKDEADFIFSLTKPEWKKKIEGYVASGWRATKTENDAGDQVEMINPLTGGPSVKPLFLNDHDPPTDVIFGKYFPIGFLPPMTDETKEHMAVRAQKDLGSAYRVRFNHV